MLKSLLVALMIFAAPNGTGADTPASPVGKKYYTGDKSLFTCTKLEYIGINQYPFTSECVFPPKNSWIHIDKEIPNDQYSSLFQVTYDNGLIGYIPDYQIPYLVDEEQYKQQQEELAEKAKLAAEAEAVRAANDAAYAQEKAAREADYKAWLEKIHKKDMREMAAAKAEAARRAKLPGVSIGMTREEALASSWGKPSHINRTTTASGTREQWVYRGSHSYLYFDNGVLTAIQN